jgi:hypothetical protein
MTDIVLYLHLALGLFVLAALVLNRVRQWKAPVLAAALLLVLSGAYNFMTHMAGAPKGWHAFIGIKLLLALHVIAMLFLMSRGTAPPEKVARWRKGALVSCTLVVAIGLYFSNFAS